MRGKIMIRTPFLATIAVAAVSFGFISTTNAAINYTFADWQLLNMTIQDSEQLSASSLVEVKANSAATPLAGRYGLAGGLGEMEYAVGFAGGMTIDDPFIPVLSPLGNTFGTLYIGEVRSLDTGADTFLSADFSNHNDDKWRFGIWVEDALGVRHESMPALTLAAPSVGSATLDISNIDIRKMGFYVSLHVADRPLGGFQDDFHVSLQGREGSIRITPEPASMLVWGLGLGLVGAIGYCKRRRMVA
jgi:hypothetical protein